MMMRPGPNGPIMVDLGEAIGGVMQEQFDAVLYLGPKSEITYGGLPKSLCADPEYVEMRRRPSAMRPPEPRRGLLSRRRLPQALQGGGGGTAQVNGGRKVVLPLRRLSLVRWSRLLVPWSLVPHLRRLSLVPASRDYRILPSALMKSA